MNNKIEPHYVDYDTAKWLKEKGFDEFCYRTYDHYQELSPFPITEDMGGKKVDPLDYKWNNSAIHSSIITAPEQWLVIEWLRINHDIYVEGRLQLTSKYHKREYIAYIDCIDINCNLRYLTPQEAISAAFNYIKNNHLI